MTGMFGGNLRTVLIIGGAVGAAAGIAGVLAVTLFDGETSDGRRVPKGDEIVCLRAPLPFVADATPECLTSADLKALAEAPLADPNGGPARVTLAHPTDLAAAPQSVESCAQYRPLADAGWGGLSSRDMRREQVFQRACGAIDMLARAEFPTKSFFAGDALSAEDLKSLAPSAIARIAPDGDRLDGESLSIEADGDGRWIIRVPNEETSIEEIAHADFNGDGLGDVLFAAGQRASGGTLSTAFVGYFTKTGANAAVGMEID